MGGEWGGVEQVEVSRCMLGVECGRVEQKKVSRYGLWGVVEKGKVSRCGPGVGGTQGGQQMWTGGGWNTRRSADMSEVHS